MWKATFLLGSVALVLASGCAKPPALADVASPKFAQTAPDSFDVLMKTTKGPVTVRVYRAWAPLGADRFYSLVQGRYYDGVAFFRVVRQFVAQFGLHGDPAVNAAWDPRTIPDDTTVASNTRGILSFAHGGPGSRSVQLFFNLGDNARLDHLPPAGFAPLGKATLESLPALDALETKYSGGGLTELAGPDQDSIVAKGDEYLRREFPDLDRIESARVVRSWK